MITNSKIASIVLRFGIYSKWMSKAVREHIEDVQRQLADAKEDARNWKAEAEDNLCGWRGSKAELAEAKAEIEADDRNVNNLMDQVHEMSKELEAMRPMIEACKAKYSHHHSWDEDPCQCLTCQWYRDYIERKQA